MRRLALVILSAVLALAGTTASSQSATHVRSATPRDQASQEIAVVGDMGDKKSGIWLINVNGNRIATLTRPRHAGWFDTDPAWSPDGTEIAFTHQRPGQGRFQVYVMQADGSQVHRVTRGIFDQSPAWSPDGRWIATQSADGIHLVHPDGSDNHIVHGTSRPSAAGRQATADSPSWTPKDRLAYHIKDRTNLPTGFCARRASRCGWIVTTRPNGSDRRPLARGSNARWSPDGRFVVYEKQPPPDYGVAIKPAAGGKPRVLDYGIEAAWSADGKQIVFTRANLRIHKWQIWTISRNGGRRHLLFSGASMPAWRPIPAVP